MAHPVADIFRQAAQANISDPRRGGNVISIEPGCDVIVAGDIHGNRGAMVKILSRANLAANANCRIVFQEVIHGPANPTTKSDRSIELLMRLARLRISNPQQVLLVLGNHDLAQATGNEIAKEGCGMCKAFTEAVRIEFKHAADEVLEAVNEFLLTIPLAARCPNGVFISHSLPSPSRMQKASPEILDRPYEQKDLVRGGAVYEWTWGRGQTHEQLQQLAEQLKVSYFILGHRHAEAGFEIISPLGLTISSDTQRGHVIRFASDEPFGPENLDKALMPIAAW